MLLSDSETTQKLGSTPSAITSVTLGFDKPKPGFVVMEIQPEKEERTELTHSQIVAPQREPILADAEIQPEKENAHRIKFLAVETWVRGVLGSISVGRTDDSIVRDSIQRIGTADPANFQLIAALQMEMLAGDHQIALMQSRRIFFW